MEKTLVIIATMIAGWVGSVPTLFDLPASIPIQAKYVLVATSGIFVFVLVWSAWRSYWRARPKIFKHESDTYQYMCKVLQNRSPAIFSVRMGYTNREDVRQVLRQKAQARDLAVYLPRKIDFADELQRLGAEIYIYGDEQFTPQSRFTIVRRTRADAEIFFGHEKDGQFVIQRFKASDQEPAYYLALDLLDIVKHHYIAVHRSTAA